MGSDKRASMREGPLAELFRKTAQDEGAQPDAPERPAERPSRPREDPLPRRAERPPGPAALRHEEPEPHVPSAKERLSAAFSQDIPSDLLERPAVSVTVPATSPGSRRATCASRCCAWSASEGLG